jgi:crossover junction endodeoxyribonuclease RuvC
MKVMGIDVGVRYTGYAIIEDGRLLTSGVYHTIDTVAFPKRIRDLYKAIKLLIKKESPDVAVYESLFYHRNPRTLCMLAQTRGVLLLAAEEMGVCIKEYTPAEIKQAISGNGRASKYQVRGMVERLLGVKLPLQPDIGDAVACALCYHLRDGER